MRFLFLLGIFLSYASYAKEPVIETIQVPNCLAKHLPASYPILAENVSFKIIAVPQDKLDEVVLTADKVGCGRFINITDEVMQDNKILPKKLQQQLQQSPRVYKLIKNTYAIKHPAEVTETINKINPNTLWDTITHLTQYPNRSAMKDTGVEVAHWLKKTVDDLISENGQINAETYFVPTGHYKQPSLILAIGKNLQAPAVVIGAHMDTLDGTMPGAGDDGSGSATLLEMTRAILSQHLDYQRPIYIIWYAAEERGLVGSRYVVADFLQKHIPVYSVLQYDMTGYRSNPNDPSIWMFRDYTDENLSGFIADLIKTYVKVPIKYSQCGYGCSDHVSWYDQGFPAAFPCETSYRDHNPFIHTSRDVLSLLNQEHMINFTKLAVAYVVELALG